MGLKSFLLHQLSRPSGLLAPVTARLLNRGNAQQNTDCIDALGLESNFKVLDIGFGGGVSFPRLLAECAEGRVAGTEVSPEMLARARSTWAGEIAKGRIEVVEGAAEHLVFGDDSFDRVMTVNTVYFWPELPIGLGEVLRVLSPGGRFVASVVSGRTLRKMGFADEGFRTESPDFYASALEAAGFTKVRTDETGDAKGSVLVSGSKP